MGGDRRLLRRGGNRGAVANAAQALAEPQEQRRAVERVVARLMELHPLAAGVPALGRAMLARAGRADFPMVTAADVAAPGDHVVSLYEADEPLVRSVLAFLLPGCAAGDPVVVVATAAHRLQLVAALSAAGVQAEELARDGRLVVLDAAETLARFMVDGRPDPDRFESVVGGVVAEVTATGAHARVYGEMVALLWAEGNATAAVALEGLWNQLAASGSFSLCCGYPVAAFGRDGDVARHAPFGAMCAQHSALLVAPPV